MDHSGLLDEFDRHLSAYAAYAEKLRTLVIELLNAQSLKVHSVAARVKHRDSFATKVARAEGRYKMLTDVTDLAGIRIITYFENDVDRVAQVIRDEFAIDTVNSVDRRDLLDPDRFGYLSLHYVATLAPARVALPEYRRHIGLKAEIQIRSILQHAWAEIEHDLGYKTALGVPRDVRRQFSRLAGLLEIADVEFAAIREALAKYEEALPAEIERAPEAVLLDKASLKAFVRTNEYAKALDRQIAEFVGGDVTEMADIMLESEVAGLNVLGLRSVADVEAALREHEAMILKFARHWLQEDGEKVGGVSETVCLLYLAYVLLGEGGSTERTFEYLEAARIDSEDQRHDVAKQVVETYRKLRGA